MSVVDPTWLNDNSEFQKNWVHGRRNSNGLHLQYELIDDSDAHGKVRVVTTWTPGDEHVGFPGYVHGGLIAAVLDDAMGRSTAIFKRWVVTGRFNVRFRSGAKAGEPLRVEGWIVRYQKRLVTAAALAKTGSGEVVAEADGTYLPVPEESLTHMVAAWPGFAEYLGER